MARFRDLSHVCRMQAASAGLNAPRTPAKNAPVAQLDRALDYESRGQEFESLRARHFGTKLGTPKPAVFALSAATSVRRSTLFDPMMSGIVDSGREGGHGNVDANDPGCVKTPTSNLRVESLSRLR